MITLVTGYTKTGKSTLPLLFNGSYSWNYAVYSLNKLKIRPVNEIQITKYVKNEINLEVPDDRKDLKVLGNFTYRDILEKFLLEKERTYFISKCYNGSINGNENYDLMITDFRFPEEYTFLKNMMGMKNNIRTIRIFRDIPELKSEKYDRYESDHALDNFKTDYLLVPMLNYDKNFKLAIKQFPQYENYMNNSRTYFI